MPSCQNAFFFEGTLRKRIACNSRQAYQALLTMFVAWIALCMGIKRCWGHGLRSFVKHCFIFTLNKANMIHTCFFNELLQAQQFFLSTSMISSSQGQIQWIFVNYKTPSMSLFIWKILDHIYFLGLEVHPIVTWFVVRLIHIRIRSSALNQIRKLAGVDSFDSFYNSLNP